MNIKGKMGGEIVVLVKKPLENGYEHPQLYFPATGCFVVLDIVLQYPFLVEQEVFQSLLEQATEVSESEFKTEIEKFANWEGLEEMVREANEED